MTTIAADRKAGVMCSDSFWTDGDECGNTKKVFRIRGALLGGCGTSQYLDKWFECYRKNKPLPKSNDVYIMRLSSKGLDAWAAVDGGWREIEQSQFAIGTGGKTARGALAAGATCAQAVRIACSIDAESGGPVRTYRLNN